MLLSDLTVEVRDRDLVRVGQLTEDDLVGSTFVPRVNAVGSWEVSLPDSVEQEDGSIVPHELAAALREEGAGLIVTGPNGVEISGPMTEATFEATGDDPLGVWTIVGVSDDVILQDATAWPQPENGDEATQNRNTDDRAGAAETVLRQYVDANIGPSAPGSRRGRLARRLRLENDQGRGVRVTQAVRFPNLLELVQTIASLGGLLFRVVQDGDALVLRISEGRDRSRFVSLDLENDQLSAVKYGIGAPTVTRAIVAGESTAVDFVLLGRSTAASEAAADSWGRRIETFVSQSSDDTDELRQAGDEALVEGSTTVVATEITPSEDLAETFGSEWRLGDLVTVVVGEAPGIAPVTEAPMQVSEDGLRIGAKVGDAVGFDADSLGHARQERTESRVSALERRLPAVTPPFVLPGQVANSEVYTWTTPFMGQGSPFVRIGWIDGIGAYNGTTMEFLLAGVGDFGWRSRASLRVQVAQRGEGPDSVSVKAEAWNAAGGSVWKIFTKWLGGYRFEIWAQVAAWQEPLQVTNLYRNREYGRSGYTMDAATLGDPGGLREWGVVPDYQNLGNVAWGFNSGVDWAREHRITRKGNRITHHFSAGRGDGWGQYDAVCQIDSGLAPGADVFNTGGGIGPGFGWAPATFYIQSDGWIRLLSSPWGRPTTVAGFLEWQIKGT